MIVSSPADPCASGNDTSIAKRIKRMTTVLIVDDNADFRARVRIFLSTEAYIQVVSEAGDGEQALRETERLHPDLVLMDIRMPGMNGLETTRRLLGRSPVTRVILLSQYDLDAYREAAVECGARDYVIKNP
jgi:DNA-binding NarL/FixJ family response regulator